MKAGQNPWWNLSFMLKLWLLKSKWPLDQTDSEKSQYAVRQRNATVCVYQSLFIKLTTDLNDMESVKKKKKTDRICANCCWTTEEYPKYNVIIHHLKINNGTKPNI